MRKALLALALIGFSTAVYAQSMGEKSGINSTLGISPSTADFVKQVAMSDMTELAGSRIGQERGNQEDKAFSTQMIADHTKTSGELKALVSGNRIQSELPSTLDNAHQKKIDALRDAKPKNFSSEYRAFQVEAHEDAVSLFERYSKGGDNDVLKQWAAKTLPGLQHHLEMAKALKAK